METRCETPYGAFELRRSLDEQNRSLIAWSSADLYILNTLAERDVPEGASILIVNDSFGALTVALSSRFKVINYSDSFCARKFCRENLKRNGIDEKSCSFISPEEDLPQSVEHIIIKNPKSLAYLEFQLQLISKTYPAGTPVLATDMARNVHSSTVKLFEFYLGDVTTSLAWKKARLIMGQTDGNREPLNPYPLVYSPEGKDFSLVNYPNLFAYGRLDPGAAFMIHHMPEPKNKPREIIDLACGDGILALKAAGLWPNARFLCIDESHLAVRSARESFEYNGLRERADFLVSDVLEGVERESADLILCNPPFHDSHSLSTSTAMKMFEQSHEVLKSGGELFVIANSHLGYEKTLKRLFSKVKISDRNKKFVVIRAER